MGLAVNPLFELTRDYFDNYLPIMRKCSPKTKEIYQKVMNQYLDHIKGKRGIHLYAVTIDMINKTTVTDYLQYVENERNCSVKTRNHRLDCIRSFMKYASDCSIQAAEKWSEIKTIPHAKEASTPVEYLTIPQVELVISQPDTTQKMGLRDSFLILFMYQTGARVAELCSIQLCDLQLDENPVVTIHGKGNKARKVPLREKLVDHLRKYLHIFHPGSLKYSTEYLFYTIHEHRHTKMTEDNVRRLVQRYGDMARKVDPGIPERVHPHIFRHSIAMHLYQNGVELSQISEWLGHTFLETTLIYAYSDTEHKRRNIEKAIPEDSTLKKYLNADRYIEKDDEMVRHLYGLK